MAVIDNINNMRKAYIMNCSEEEFADYLEKLTREIWGDSSRKCEIKSLRENESCPECPE